MNTDNLPAYVDPAVLVPGARVVSVTDLEHPLTVQRIEPMLVCVDDDGNGHVVYAHAVVPYEQPA